MSKVVDYDAGKYPLIAVKVSKMPKKHNRSWLRLCYSVNSAPEYWTFCERSAKRVGKDVYVFDTAGFRSNNATPFSKERRNVTLILDFGKTGDEGVVVDWIKSASQLEDIKHTSENL